MLFTMTTVVGACTGGYTTVTFAEDGYHWPRALVASTQHTKPRTSNLIKRLSPWALFFSGVPSGEPQVPHLQKMMIPCQGRVTTRGVTLSSNLADTANEQV